MKIKYMIASASAALSTAIPALAQEAAANQFDLSKAEKAAEDLGNAVGTLFTDSILPAVIVVVSASLAIWGLFVVIRWIRRAGR